MAPKIPARPGTSGKPSGKVDLLDLLGEHLFNSIIAKPLGFLLSIFLPGEPEDWDTLDEIRDGFESWLGNIPILGDLLSMFNGTYSGSGVGASIAGYFSGERAKISSVAGSVGSVTKTAITTGVVDGFTWTRYVYTSNGTFTTPTPPAGKRIAKIASACINGGSGGETPSKEDRGGEGGVGGGYQYREHSPAAVGAAQTITVGAGAGAESHGGTSSFGSLNVGKRDTSAIWSAQGAISSANKPGRGGAGGSFSATATAGYRGESSALAVGGAGGNKNSAGSAGGAVTSDPFHYSGGAGGGGSGAKSGSGFSVSGGAGSAPGGGGGGGGSCENNVTIPVGTGGSGANGGVAVWVYFEDDI